MIYFLKNNSIVADSGEDCSQIEKFIELYKIKVVTTLNDIENIYLLYNDRCLSIANKLQPEVNPVAVNFLNSHIKKRLTSSRLKTELLSKALGKKHNYKTVLDATAGMGVDSMIFASLGLRVQSYEMSTLIYLLLYDGLNRAKEDIKLHEIVKNINLNHANSLNFKNDVDIVYLDFMFSKSDKKAKSKKNMEIFKIITELPSQEQLVDNFSKYLEINFKRLIFKRPLKADVLKIGRFSHSITGKAIRYDIYLPS